MNWICSWISIGLTLHCVLIHFPVMIATIVFVVAFKNSSHLTNAYG